MFTFFCKQTFKNTKFKLNWYSFLIMMRLRIIKQLKVDLAKLVHIFIFIAFILELQN